MGSTWRRLMRCSNESLMVLQNASFLEKLSSHVVSREALNSKRDETISLSFSSSKTMPWPVLLMYELMASLSDSRALTLEKSKYILWRSSIRFPSISIAKPYYNTRNNIEAMGKKTEITRSKSRSDQNLIKNGRYMTFKKLLFCRCYQWLPSTCIQVDQTSFMFFLQSYLQKWVPKKSLQ